MEQVLVISVAMDNCAESERVYGTDFESEIHFSLLAADYIQLDI